MYISYKKLWMKLAGLEMRKKDLCALANISMAPLTKMGKGGHVTSEILMKMMPKRTIFYKKPYLK